MTIARGEGPLAGVRVLDLTRVLAGPWATQCLADLGAEVLKVEEPGAGDETRGWGPPWFGDTAAYFACANRSKASLALDLKDAAAQQAVRRLAGAADILVENFKAGAMERFGLGLAALEADNPRLICASISGYGRSGPNADRAGYDFVVQAESGLMSVTGPADGGPHKVGVAVSDLITGLYLSQAVLAALYERERTGRGRRIEAALFDCQLAAMANVASNALATGRPPARHGNAHANIVPYETFDTATDPIALAIGNDRQFAHLCAALGLPALAEDPRFTRNAARVENRQALRPVLADALRTRALADWLALLRPLGLPAGGVASVTEALGSEQASARGLLVELAQPGGPPIRVVRYPVRLSGGLPAPVTPPALGEGGRALAERWLGAALPA